MVLKLYGFPTSTCTQRVGLVLHEKKVPFELIAIDIFNGEHKTPPYLAKQPFGQIPYIDDDGFQLFESRAIGRYIAKKYASQGLPLIPTDLEAFAKFEQAASIELCDFDPYAISALTENFWKPRKGLQPDKAVFEKSIETLRAKLAAYDVILSKQKYAC